MFKKKTLVLILIILCMSLSASVIAKPSSDNSSSNANTSNGHGSGGNSPNSNASNGNGSGNISSISDASNGNGSNSSSANGDATVDTDPNSNISGEGDEIGQNSESKGQLPSLPELAQDSYEPPQNEQLLPPVGLPENENSANTVPEPATIALIMLGFGAMGVRSGKLAGQRGRER